MVLDAGRIPYLLVRIPDGWRVPGDRHPDARAARFIAVSVSKIVRQKRALHG